MLTYGPREKYLLGFVCLFSHLPWRPWGVGNMASWIMLSFLARLSDNDFMGSPYVNTTWNNHMEAVQLSNKLIPIFVVPHTFWWKEGFDLALHLFGTYIVFHWILKLYIFKTTAPYLWFHYRSHVFTCYILYYKLFIFSILKCEIYLRCIFVSYVCTHTHIYIYFQKSYLILGTLLHVQ